jgi:hypothetical protein
LHLRRYSDRIDGERKPFNPPENHDFHIHPLVPNNQSNVTNSSTFEILRLEGDDDADSENETTVRRRNLSILFLVIQGSAAETADHRTRPAVATEEI